MGPQTTETGQEPRLPWAHVCPSLCQAAASSRQDVGVPVARWAGPMRVHRPPPNLAAVGGRPRPLCPCMSLPLEVPMASSGACTAQPLWLHPGPQGRQRETGEDQAEPLFCVELEGRGFSTSPVGMTAARPESRPQRVSMATLWLGVQEAGACFVPALSTAKVRVPSTQESAPGAPLARVPRTPVCSRPWSPPPCRPLAGNQ